MQSIIIPRIMSGFLELLPSEQLIFDTMKSTIEQVFQNNGFMAIDTPVLELSEVLLAKAGGETEKQIYRFSKGDNDMSLRFDLTVPLARYVAEHKNELCFPFKRYHIAKVYRGERPQKGRFREFYQCDADIVGDGSLSILADAECISLISKVYNKLNINDIQIQLNNRKILIGLMQMLGIEKVEETLHLLDKIDKVSEEVMVGMLSELGIEKEKIEFLISIMNKEGSNQEKIDYLKSLKSENELFNKGINELEQVVNALSNMNVSEDSYVIKFSIIRGLDYYTGTIFETKMLSHLEFGSIGGGGRYDNLASHYTKSILPGVGVSFGLTRLFDCLMKNNMLNSIIVPIKPVGIIPLGETQKECLSLAEYLISKDIKTTVLYDDKSFKAKLGYANKENLKFVVIVGEDEVKNKKYAIKNMQNGEQQNLSKEEIVNLLKGKN